MVGILVLRRIHRVLGHANGGENEYCNIRIYNLTRAHAVIESHTAIAAAVRSTVRQSRELETHHGDLLTHRSARTSIPSHQLFALCILLCPLSIGVGNGSFAFLASEGLDHHHSTSLPLNSAILLNCAGLSLRLHRRHALAFPTIPKTSTSSPVFKTLRRSFSKHHAHSHFTRPHYSTRSLHAAG